jgi:hypothetical protein
MREWIAVHVALIAQQKGKNVMKKSLSPEELNNMFKHHPPTQSKAMKHEIVRASCRSLATVLVDVCPPSLERDTAIEKLRETMHWGNSAIACNPATNERREDPPPDGQPMGDSPRTAPGSRR